MLTSVHAPEMMTHQMSLSP